MRSFPALIDLVLPNRCAGCAAPGAAWCPRCARTLHALRPVEHAGLPPAYALAPYEGPPRLAVLAYKERGRRELASHLAKALAAALRTVPAAPVTASASPGSGDPPAMPLAGAGPLVLVPAPSRPAAARRRGGQHMAVVAERCAAAVRATGVPAHAVRALRLNGRAVDSVGLDAADRAANLAGRLRPVPGRAPPPGARVVLLDDVITTGATAVACVSALASAGVAVAAVLAVTTAG